MYIMAKMYKPSGTKPKQGQLLSTRLSIFDPTYRALKLGPLATATLDDVFKADVCVANGLLLLVSAIAGARCTITAAVASHAVGAIGIRMLAVLG